MLARQIYLIATSFFWRKNFIYVRWFHLYYLSLEHKVCVDDFTLHNGHKNIKMIFKQRHRLFQCFFPINNLNLDIEWCWTLKKYSVTGHQRLHSVSLKQYYSRQLFLQCLYNYFLLLVYLHYKFKLVKFSGTKVGSWHPPPLHHNEHCCDLVCFVYFDEILKFKGYVITCCCNVAWQNHVKLTSPT